MRENGRIRGFLGGIALAVLTNLHASHDSAATALEEQAECARSS
jgi:hypothetical protein